MIEQRPHNCPNHRCLCLYSPGDEEERVCFGALPPEDWEDHDGLINSLCRCEDGELMKFNLPDAFYETRGFIKAMLHALRHGFPNACGEVGIADPVRELIQLLQGERQ